MDIEIDQDALAQIAFHATTNEELAGWVRKNAPSDAPGWELVAYRLETTPKREIT